MAKVNAPFLSFGGSGQIGKSMVAGKWRGIPYVRQYVIPSNPQTVAQQANRTRFAFLRELWKLAPTGLQAPWDRFAQGRPFTGMNKIVGENQRVMQGDTDLSSLIMSPGAAGGIALASYTAVTGGATGEIDITGVAPTLPSGWTLDAVCAAALPDQDPTGILAGPIVYGEDDTAPYAFTLAGFASGVDVAVGVWARYLKPDGSTAYSVSSINIVAAGV